MKAVLISIKPKWCELIANGKKTVEVRKTKPKIDEPFKCYIYCTKSRTPYESFGVNKQPIECGGKVIGEFVCEKMSKFDSIDYITPEMVSIGMASCLTEKEFVDYVGNNFAYGWHISNLVIYDKPKELGEFKKPCNHENDCCTCDRYNPFDHLCRNEVTRPPQSWQFVEDLGV